METKEVYGELLKDKRVNFLSETIDLTPDVIIGAHKDENYSVLCRTKETVRRESENLQGAGVAMAISAPATVTLYRMDSDLFAGVAFFLTILAAASYHQATLGLEACRKDILARYTAKAPPPPAP